MPDTGWVIAGTGTSDSTVGTEPWANPSNITASDDSDADGDAADKAEQMEYIKGSNFGLSIPGGSTIDGIEIRAEMADSFAVAYITHATVEHPSSGFGNDLETGSTTLTATDTNYDYGGVSELFGLSWIASDVNNSGFGVAFSVNATTNGFFAGDPHCDAIWVKVYYTPPAGRNQFQIIG